jgi:hypothetical protein
MRKVFMVGNFSSADIIRKGILLRPGEQHKLQARVYNFLQEDVSGQLQTQLPEHWGALIGDGQFVAPAGGVSEPVELAFTVPGGPGPWVQAEIPNKYRIKVDLPQTASVNTSLNLAGTIGSGPLEEMLYRVYVGAYPSKGGSVVDEQVEPRRRLYWLASGITGAPR